MVVATDKLVSELKHLADLATYVLASRSSDRIVDAYRLIDRLERWQRSEWREKRDFIHVINDCRGFLDRVRLNACDRGVRLCNEAEQILRVMETTEFPPTDEIPLRHVPVSVYF